MTNLWRKYIFYSLVKYILRATGSTERGLPEFCLHQAGQVRIGGRLTWTVWDIFTQFYLGHGPDFNVSKD